MTPQPRLRKKIPGAGFLLDYRGTGLLPPNGGLIRPLVGIEHIPVYPNKKGRADFIGLAQILKDQGLSLQTATDSEGNVCLYNSLNRLCYQARGVNQQSYGTEHMHLSVGEHWNKRQFYAAAWIWQYAEREFGIPFQRAKLRRGSGNTCLVIARGHCSHKREAAIAGYHDRTDPGSGFDDEFVRHCALYYKRHHTFHGA